MSGKAINLIGQTFGNLTVIRREQNTPDGHPKWMCRCKCGNTYIAQGRYLKSGATKSCGCISNNTQSGEMAERDMIGSSISLYRLKRNKQNPYQSLANAIIAVAADDYRTALNRNDQKLKNSLENFFYSNWYKILTNTNPNPDILVNLLRRECSGNLSVINI